MGHPDNVTNHTFEHLFKGKKENEAKKIVFEYLTKKIAGEKVESSSEIEGMFLKASKAWGQSIGEAEKQTFNMLKSEM